jgi:TolA-binding protein
VALWLIFIYNLWGNKTMLDYFALGLLIFVALVLFYGIIALHDIPYEIAKARQHPQQDAIHVAGWISLFTLHAIWPFLWIWATLFRQDRGWGFINDTEEQKIIPQLQNQIGQLQQKLITVESEERTQILSLQEQFTQLQARIEDIESKANKENP